VLRRVKQESIRPSSTEPQLSFTTSVDQSQDVPVRYVALVYLGLLKCGFVICSKSHYPRLPQRGNVKEIS